MISLYNIKTISSIDSHTIANGKGSLELVDYAAEAFVHWLIPKVSLAKKIHIICGKGNNGADGFAICLKLLNYGYSVMVLLVNSKIGISFENGLIRHKVESRNDVVCHVIRTLKDLSQNQDNAILIDALLGNGVSRELEGFYRGLVTKLNTDYNQIYAVDCPSGLLAHDHKTSLAIRATATLSFEYPKLSFFAPENEKFVGKWDFVPIGLIEPPHLKSTSSYHLIEQNDVTTIFIKRIQFSHKGLMGKALFLMTNDHMIGASLLAAKACFKMGAGIVLGQCSQNSQKSLAIKEPEIIFKSSDVSNQMRIVNAICLGPGLGMNEQSIRYTETILNTCKSTLILDADALNIIAKNDWIDKVPEGTIITPHIKEFERIFGAFSSHQTRVEAQKRYSLKYKIYIILKGRFTSISDMDGNIYYNQTGNPSLAKGGSGDILAGMITSLVSQKYSQLDACVASVWVHGQAADQYVLDFDEKTLTPLNLIDYIAIVLANNNDIS